MYECRPILNECHPRFNELHCTNSKSAFISIKCIETILYKN